MKKIALHIAGVQNDDDDDDKVQFADYAHLIAP
jgi:hypothetical protein